MENKLIEIADANLKKLAENTYPGRGIIAGLDETEKYLIQVYWIMGRSANSRNRIFAETMPGRLVTEAADSTKVKDPSLIMYTAMNSLNNQHFSISNGHQTDDALKAAHWCILLHADTNFSDKWKYEPDEPNFTPRITSVFTKEANNFLQISIIKKSPFDDSCTRHLHLYSNLHPGFGYCVTTYKGDGDPLPSFEGEPFLLPLEGSHEFILDSYWSTLNQENKISLAVKFINIETWEEKTLIKNKYEKVA